MMISFVHIRNLLNALRVAWEKKIRMKDLKIRHSWKFQLGTFITFLISSNEKQEIDSMNGVLMGITVKIEI